MNKLLSVLTLTLLIAASVFATGQAEAEPEGPAQISLMVKAGFNADGAIDQSAITPFMAEHPEIEVELITVDNNRYNDRLLVTLAADNASDVVNTDSVAALAKYIETGSFVALDQMIEDVNYDMSAYNPGAIQISKQLGDGLLYNLPDVLFVDLLAYNKQHFDEYGVAYPQPGITIEEFLETARQLMVGFRESGAFETGSRPVSTWATNDIVRNYPQRAGAFIYDADTNEITADEPEVARVIRFLYDMAQEDLVMLAAEAQALGYAPPHQGFARGFHAMDLEGSWVVNPISRFHSETEGLELSDFDVTTAPRFADSPDVAPPYGFSSWAITNDTANEAAAFELLTFLSKEYNDNAFEDFGKINLYARNDLLAVQELQSRFPGLEDVLAQSTAAPIAINADYDNATKQYTKQYMDALSTRTDDSFEEILEGYIDGLRDIIESAQ